MVEKKNDKWDSYSTGLSNPYSIDVFGNSIYWTTQNRSEIGKIRYMDKTAGEMHDLISGVQTPTGIKVWHRQRYPLGGKDNLHLSQPNENP